MIWCIITGIILLGTGAVIGWKARAAVDEINDDIEMAFREALNKLE